MVRCMDEGSPPAFDSPAKSSYEKESFKWRLVTSILNTSQDYMSPECSMSKGTDETLTMSKTVIS